MVVKKITSETLNPNAWKANYTCLTLEQGSQTGPAGPLGGHGPVLWGSRAEAFTR